MLYFTKALRTHWHAAQGYKHFKDTDGNHSQGKKRNPIIKKTVESDLSYIADFCYWLEMWKIDSGSLKGLSCQTFAATIRTCKGIIALVRCLFDHYSQLNFILITK